MALTNTDYNVHTLGHLFSMYNYLYYNIIPSDTKMHVKRLSLCILKELKLNGTIKLVNGYTNYGAFILYALI